MRRPRVDFVGGCVGVGFEAGRMGLLVVRRDCCVRGGSTLKMVGFGFGCGSCAAAAAGDPDHKQEQDQYSVYYYAYTDEHAAAGAGDDGA